MTEFKKGRKPRAAAPLQQIEGEAFDVAVNEARQVIANQEQSDMIALGEQLGRMQAAGFFATIANSLLISTFENVKKSKAWRKMANAINGKLFENFEEFCEVQFGKSYRRLQEMSGNMRLLSEETYEQAEKIGLRQTDYNAIKALPAPDQELVRRAVAEGSSREEVIEVLQELASNLSKEQQELKSKLEDAQADVESKNDLLAKKNKMIDSLESKQKRIKTLPADEALKEIQKEAQSLFNDTRGLIQGNVRQALIALQNHEADSAVFMAGLVAQIKSDVIALQREFSLPDIVAGTEAEMAWVDLDLSGYAGSEGVK